MLNFGASKPRVRGIRAHGGPPGSMPHYYHMQTKLWEGNVFTGVCDSVHRGVPGPGVLHGPGGVWSPGVPVSEGGAWSPGGAWSWGMPGAGGAWWRPPGRATAAGGTHPTGMHWLNFPVNYMKM